MTFSWKYEEQEKVAGRDGRVLTKKHLPYVLGFKELQGVRLWGSTPAIATCCLSGKAHPVTVPVKAVHVICRTALFMHQEM